MTLLLQRCPIVLAAIWATSVCAFAATDNFRVVASTNSPWRGRGQFDWVLQINHQPRGSLTLGHGVTELEIGRDQRERLLRTARENEFFSLPGQLGTSSLDVPTRSLTIVSGSDSHTVVFYDPGPIARLSEAELEQLAGLPGFLAVWAAIRSLIDNPRAADERREDARLVAAFQRRMNANR